MSSDNKENIEADSSPLPPVNWQDDQLYDFTSVEVPAYDPEKRPQNDGTSFKTPPTRPREKSPSDADKLSKLVALKGALPEIEIPDEYFESSFTEDEPTKKDTACSISSLVQNRKRTAESYLGASVTFITGPPKFGQANISSFVRNIEVEGHFINNLYHSQVGGYFFPLFLPTMSAALARHHLLEHGEKVEAHGLVEYATASGKRLLLTPGFGDEHHHGIFLLRDVIGLDQPILVFKRDLNPQKHQKDFVFYQNPKTETELLKLAVMRAKGQPLRLTLYNVKPEFFGLSRELDEFLHRVQGETKIEALERVLSKRELVEESARLSLQFATAEQRAGLEKAFSVFLPYSKLDGELLEAAYQLLCARGNHVTVAKRYVNIGTFHREMNEKFQDKLSHQGRPVPVTGNLSEREVRVGPMETLFVEGQNGNLSTALEMVTPYVRSQEVSIRKFNAHVEHVITSARSLAPKIMTPERGHNRKGRYWRENLKITSLGWETFYFTTNSETKGLRSLTRCINNHIFAETLFGRVNPLGLGVVKTALERRWNIGVFEGHESFDSHTFITDEAFLSPVFQGSMISDTGPDCIIPQGVLQSLTDPRVKFNIIEHLLEGRDLEATVAIGGETFTDVITDDFAVREVNEYRAADVFLKWNNKKPEVRSWPVGQSKPLSREPSPHLQLPDLPPPHPNIKPSPMPSLWQQGNPRVEKPADPPLNELFRALHPTKPQRGRSRARGEQKEPPNAVPEKLQQTYANWLTHCNSHWKAVVTSKKVPILDAFYFFSRVCDNSANPTTHIHVLSKMDKQFHQEIKLDQLQQQPWYILPKAKMVVPDPLRHGAT